MAEMIEAWPKKLILLGLIGQPWYHHGDFWFHYLAEAIDIDVLVQSLSDSDLATDMTTANATILLLFDRFNGQWHSHILKTSYLVMSRAIFFFDLILTKSPFFVCKTVRF